MMMDLLLRRNRRRRLCCCLLTVHISESSNNGEAENVYQHPLGSVGIFNIIGCYMSFMEMGSCETRRSSVNRVVGRPSIIVIVARPSSRHYSQGRRRHISPPRHRNSKFERFVRRAEIGTVAAANVELERRQYPMSTISYVGVGGWIWNNNMDIVWNWMFVLVLLVVNVHTWKAHVEANMAGN